MEAHSGSYFPRNKQSFNGARRFLEVSNMEATTLASMEESQSASVEVGRAPVEVGKLLSTSFHGTSGTYDGCSVGGRAEGSSDFVDSNDPPRYIAA